VIALDTNLLVHAHREDSPFHGAALRAVRDLGEGADAWAIPWPCVHEFLATVTHRRIFPTHTPRERAAVQVEAWMASPALVLLAETARHWQTLRQLLSTGDVTGPRVHDARIAAICLSHGVRELWTADRDYSRFPSLRVRNPLVER
jgi:toxin-antitoxin system PIN domain toxin